MGGKYFLWIVYCLILLQLLDSGFPMPLCTDSMAPFTPRAPLQFCPPNGSTCCNNTDDLRLMNRFESMNISDLGCASIVKSILCARCDQFSAELFRVDSAPRDLPVLCNSTGLTNSTRSNRTTVDFCSQVWNTCHNISIVNSPFAPSNSNRTTLSSTWRTREAFCNAMGAGSPNDMLPCFSGSPVVLINRTDNPTPPGGLCLEKLSNGSYLSMVAHPDGSNRAFFANQQGKIWLAMIPDQGSGGVLGVEESDPFLDLSDEVHFDTEFGMMGLAFHPEFVRNGRFFASFNCDKGKWPGCAGRCACNSDVGCDPATLGHDNGAQPCQYQSVVAEYTVNGSASTPASATSADPWEVRRIFTMGLPFTSHHGGQIVFGPKDGYLYFMMGDGGGVGDPYNFAQNKKSLLGKIMRLDVDTLPSDAEAEQLGVWGNYSIPHDNPYTVDSELQREIWALGLRNPWRCSFDSARPSYFVCADTGQDAYEEVDLITKNGNYGWRIFEGPYPYTPPQSPGGNTSAGSIVPIWPVMGYNHSEVNSAQGSAAITGGYFYRSMADPCMHGRYLFADLYASAVWAGTEDPTNSGRFNRTKINFDCSHQSPIACTFTPGSPLPTLSYIFSFGEDNNKDVYILTNNGVYRIVPPSRCNYTCSMETVSPVSPAPGVRSGGGASRGSQHVWLGLTWFVCVVAMILP